MKPTHARSVLLSAAAVLLPASAMAAIGDINSIVINERIFNDFPSTTLNITDNDFSEIEFDESGFFPDGAPDFANRHAAYFSTDNVNPYAFQNSEGFDMSFDMVLSAGVPSQPKEAGIYIETFIAGQTQFLGKTGSGEYVSFGGGFPFTSSTAGEEVEYDGQTLSPGVSTNFRMIYTPGDGAANTVSATVEYFINGVSSGVLDITNTENGIIDGSNVGVYAQFPPQGFGDFAIATFTNISISPLSSVLNGDYNDSGLVEQGDLDQVLANWGAGFASIPATWINQRPTEGIVDQAELDVVLTEWGSSAAPSFAGSNVPEPATAALLGASVLTLLRRRTAA